MKAIEALNHDWKVGEEVYVACYAYVTISPNDTLREEKPYKVVKKKVSNIKTNNYETWRSIHIDLEGDDGLDEDISAYKNRNLCCMESDDSFGTKCYKNQEFCDSKFFTQEEAENYLKEEYVRWNIHLSERANKNACHIKKMKKAIADLEKENISLQEQIILSR